MMDKGRDPTKKTCDEVRENTLTLLRLTPLLLSLRKNQKPNKIAWFPHNLCALAILMLVGLPISAEAGTWCGFRPGGGAYWLCGYSSPDSAGQAAVDDWNAYFAGVFPCWAGYPLKYLYSRKITVDYYNGTSVTFVSTTCDRPVVWTDNIAIKYFDNKAPHPKNLGNKCGVGNPIIVETGNKLQIEKDYTSPNVLKFERIYNSSQTMSSSITSRMGYRWRHTYLRNIAPPAPAGTIPPEIESPSYTTLGMYRPDGQQLTFNLVDGVWRSDADINASISPILDNMGTVTGWEYSQDDQIETYNAEGVLLSIKDRNGLTQTLIYSDASTPTSIAPRAGLLIKVVDSFGQSIQFTYANNTTYRIVTMTDPAGSVFTYSYDSGGNLKTVTYPDTTPSVLTDNPKKTYVYGSDSGETVNTGGASQPHALTGIIDENGVRYATYQYDANGKAISTQHASNNIEKFNVNYAADGSSAAVTDPLGSIRTTHFTTVLGMIKSTGTDQPGGSGCSAASSAVAYDANGNVASRIDFNGHRTLYSYDLTRNLETSRTEGLTASGQNTPQTRIVTTEWHPTFRLPSKITEPGLETRYSYDSKGNITFKSLKDLVTNKTRNWNTSYTYSVSGILLQKNEDGPRTDVSDLTIYDYYPEDAVCTGGHIGCRGQLKQMTNALGHTSQITRYSPNGLPEAIIDPNGLTTTLSYDARQRLVALDIGGELTTYTYDRVGLMTRITQANGAYLAYQYDNAHRLIKVNDQLGNTRTYSLDNFGNRIKEELFDPSGQLVRSQNRVYDALSRLQNLILPQ